MWSYYAFEALELAERRRGEAERARRASLASGNRLAEPRRRSLARLGAPVAASVRRLASLFARSRPGAWLVDAERRRRSAA